jgi:hypothetical protein
MDLVSSTVKAFPLYRRQKLLGDIASELQSKQGEEASRYWRETAKELLQRLSDQGVDSASAQEEVRTLLYAVLAEMESKTATG